MVFIFMSPPPPPAASHPRYKQRVKGTQAIGNYTCGNTPLLPLRRVVKGWFATKTCSLGYRSNYMFCDRPPDEVGSNMIVPGSALRIHADGQSARKTCCIHVLAPCMYYCCWHGNRGAQIISTASTAHQRIAYAMLSSDISSSTAYKNTRLLHNVH